MKACLFCKKVCSGDRGLPPHMYHNKECFQKLSDISKNYRKFTLVNTKEQESSIHQMFALHPNKVSKLQNGIDINNINAFNQTQMSEYSMVDFTLIYYSSYHQFFYLCED